MADESPFGTAITSDDIVDTLSFFDAWDDRYRYIIDLGRELPPLPDGLKTDDRIVRGCQSQVWLDVRDEGGRLLFNADSDAFIVKGLLAVVLAAYNNRSREEILDFDIDDYFERLELLKHLSPTRGNGLRAVVAKVREAAAT